MDAELYKVCEYEEVGNMKFRKNGAIVPGAIVLFFCRTYFLAFSGGFAIMIRRRRERGQYMQETVYSVSEAVKLLEIQSHVLRYWEEEMKLPIQRNEMGHRYYTRYDIQVFLSIKELKKKGYSLKEIGKLIPLFYHNKQNKEIEESNQEKIKVQPEPKAKLEPKSKPKIYKSKPLGISREFMEIVSRLVQERLEKENSEEARYKRLDERIRNYQQSRREVAAAAEQKKTKRTKRKK